MFTVALIGPDGAGKTTIGRRLERTLPFRVKYLYMGVSADSSNVLLPTTRLVRSFRSARARSAAPGPASGPASRPGSGSGIGSKTSHALAAVRAGARLANRLGEEWFRQGLAWYHVRRGRVVIFDRHFYSDYYVHDVAPNGRARSLARRVHGFVLAHLYPQPDLLILLDAPAEVLHARKPEDTLVALEQRRLEYFELKAVTPSLAVVDAGRPVEEVAGEVVRLILEFSRRPGRRRREGA